MKKGAFPTNMHALDYNFRKRKSPLDDCPNAISMITKKKYVSGSRKYNNTYFCLTNEVNKHAFVHGYSKKVII